MPYNCPVCNNADYEEIDGLFFCTECQTQSQELIVQETADREVTYHQEIKVAKEGGEVSQKKKEKFFGRPWTIYEAYQIIIMAQADALIAQGANEHLKDVVFTIWANYLRHIGVAFCPKEKLVPDIVINTCHGRPRELHRGTFNNPLNRPKHSLTGSQPFQSQDDKGYLSGEQFYKEDNPADNVDNIDFLDEDVDLKTEGRLRKMKSRISRAIDSPEWMDMSKTIAICYIGLMFTNPNILPCDVIRFIYECKVPFLSVTHLLPPEMVFSGGDSALFMTGRYDTATLLTKIYQLLTYLKLNKMPSPDLDVLIPRFVKELCLPGEVASISLKLKEKIPCVWKTNGKTWYKRLELFAMGFIVLALKIALILDDTTEKKLSRYSQKLQNLIQPEIKYFVWSDWRKFIMLKTSEEFNAYREFTCDISRSTLQNMDELLDCYTKTESDKKKHTTSLLLNNNKNPKRSYQAEFRAALKKPLETALERLENDTSLQQTAKSGSKETMAAIGQEFHHSTLIHIVNTSLFQRQVEENTPEHSRKLSKLLKRYSLPRTEVLQYIDIKDEENLESHRHESYLWLVSLVSEIVDCSVRDMDRLILQLLHYLVGLSQGTIKPGQVCGQKRIFDTTEKSRRRYLPLF